MLSHVLQYSSADLESGHRIETPLPRASNASIAQSARRDGREVPALPLSPPAKFRSGIAFRIWESTKFKERELYVFSERLFLEEIPKTKLMRILRNADKALDQLLSTYGRTQTTPMRALTINESIRTVRLDPAAKATEAPRQWPIGPATTTTPSGP